MVNSPINKQLIASCGMNCSLCIAFRRDKKKCKGCNGPDTDKPVHCVKCRIKNCDMIRQSNSKLCYECSSFPCRRLRKLDERYKANYSMSMIENLRQIEQLGMDDFIKNEAEKWTCKTCGGVICVHRGHCLSCK